MYYRQYRSNFEKKIVRYVPYVRMSVVCSAHYFTSSMYQYNFTSLRSVKKPPQSSTAMIVAFPAASANSFYGHCFNTVSILSLCVHTYVRRCNSVPTQKLVKDVWTYGRNWRLRFCTVIFKKDLLVSRKNTYVLLVLELYCTLPVLR